MATACDRSLQAGALVAVGTWTTNTPLELLLSTCARQATGRRARAAAEGPSFANGDSLGAQCATRTNKRKERREERGEARREGRGEPEQSFK